MFLGMGCANMMDKNDMPYIFIDTTHQNLAIYSCVENIIVVFFSSIQVFDGGSGHVSADFGPSGPSVC